MEVGIRELKAKLSAYVELAARGETLTVTDRGKPVATLGPPPGFEDSYARGVREGWLTPPTRSGRLGPARRYKSSLTIREVLDEDRGD